VVGSICTAVKDEDPLAELRHFPARQRSVLFSPFQKSNIVHVQSVDSFWKYEVPSLSTLIVPVFIRGEAWSTDLLDEFML